VLGLLLYSCVGNKICRPMYRLCMYVLDGAL